MAENPDLAATHLLVETTLRAFPDILSGRRPATEVIFPGGSLELVQNAYATNPASAFFNRVLADDLVARLRRRARSLTADAARILEIGAARVPRAPSSWRRCGPRGWTCASTATPTYQGPS